MTDVDDDDAEFQASLRIFDELMGDSDRPSYSKDIIGGGAAGGYANNQFVGEFSSNLSCERLGRVASIPMPVRPRSVEGASIRLPYIESMNLNHGVPSRSLHARLNHVISRESEEDKPSTPVMPIAQQETSRNSRKTKVSPSGIIRKRQRNQLDELRMEAVVLENRLLTLKLEQTDLKMKHSAQAMRSPRFFWQSIAHQQQQGKLRALAENKVLKKQLQHQFHLFKSLERLISRATPSDIQPDGFSLSLHPYSLRPHDFEVFDDQERQAFTQRLLHNFYAMGHVFSHVGLDNLCLEQHGFQEASSYDSNGDAMPFLYAFQSRLFTLDFITCSTTCWHSVVCPGRSEEEMRAAQIPDELFIAQQNSIPSSGNNELHYSSKSMVQRVMNEQSTAFLWTVHSEFQHSASEAPLLVDEDGWIEVLPHPQVPEATVWRCYARFVPLNPSSEMKKEDQMVLLRQVVERGFLRILQQVQDSIERCATRKMLGAF